MQQQTQIIIIVVVLAVIILAIFTGPKIFYNRPGPYFQKPLFLRRSEPVIIDRRSIF